jgi:hypothetical protein
LLVRCYYEQYPGVHYDCSTALCLKGPWYDLYIRKYEAPANARYGCMLAITKVQYDAIVTTYGKKQ